MDRKPKLFVRTQPTSDDVSHIVLLDDQTIRVNRGSTSPFILKTNGILYNSSQKEVHQALSTLRIVDSVANGHNVVVVCYGATGVGKYYTLIGSGFNYEHRGLVPRTLTEIFSRFDNLSQTFECAVTFSAIEFFGENVYDLLSYRGPNETIVSTDKVTTQTAKRLRDALALLFVIDLNRNSLRKNRSGSKWNHFALNLIVEIRSLVHSEEKITRGKLSYLLLMSSVGQLERSMGKNEIWSRRLVAQWETDFRVRGKKLTGVGRRNQLTRFVKEDGAKFVFVLNIRLEDEYWKSTLYTLMFGQRILNIPIKVERGELVATDQKDTIQVCRKDVERLKLELYRHDLLCGRNPVNYLESTEIERRELFDATSAFMDGSEEPIKVATEQQVQSAFAMMKEIFTHAKDQFELQQKLAEQSFYESSSLPRSEMASQTDIETRSPGHADNLEPFGFGVGSASSGSKNVDRRISASFYRVKRVGSEISSIPSQKTLQLDEAFDEKATWPTPGSSTDKLTDREDAFRAYKSLAGKNLNDFFVKQKQVTEKKKEEYNKLIKEYRDVKSDVDYMMSRYEGIDRNFCYEDPLELKYEIEYLENREIKLEEDMKKLLKVIEAHKQDDHERRMNIVREFELWYEKKKMFASYQRLLQTTEYLKTGEASTVKQDHRAVAVNSYKPTEEIYNDAQAIAQNWVSHAKRTAKLIDGGKSEFDFLQ